MSKRQANDGQRDSAVIRLPADMLLIAVRPGLASELREALALLEKRRRLDGVRMHRDLLDLKADLEQDQRRLAVRQRGAA